LWEISGERIFSATGPPIFSASAPASSAVVAIWIGLTGMPKAPTTAIASGPVSISRPSLRACLRMAAAFSGSADGSPLSAAGVSINCSWLRR